MLDNPQKILIVKLSSLGDLGHALPVLCRLRKAYPTAHIAWAVESKFKDILTGHPDLDEIIEVQTQKWRRQVSLASLMEIVQLVRYIRRAHFDLVIDLQGLIKSSFITGLSGAPRRLGFDRQDCREPLSAWATNIKAPITRDVPHVVDKNRAMLQPLRLPPETPEFNLNCTEEAEHHIEDKLGQLLETNPAPVALHAAVGYPTKAWPLERFAALADQIHREFELPILLTWGPGDRDQAETIGKLMQEPYTLAPETATFQQALALYKRLRLFISGDTGPLHLCAAMGVPTVSIYGPTDPARNGPYGSRHEVVVKPQTCSFCFKRSCPTSLECMDAVQVDDVMEAVRRRLQAMANTT